MDFELTEDQKMLKAMVRDFAINEVEPIAAEIDEEARFPAENIKKAAELGLFGIGFPEEYGGGGGGKMEQVICFEELAKVCASTSTIILNSSFLGGFPIYRFGTEEQKQRLLPPILKGEKLGGLAATEPGAGSDVSALETTATRHNNGYILNGSKIFTTNGAEAEIIITFANTDKSLPHGRGITGFIIEKKFPGFSVGKLEHKLGIRATSTAELLFEDCFVPEENRLGNEGEGLRMSLSCFDSTRIGVAGMAVGIAEGAFDKALAYAKERQQFGQPIANFQGVQWMLSDMATQIDAAQLLVYRAAYLQDKDLPFIKEASMAKLFAAEMAMFVTTKAIQIHGGYGYIKEYPVERYWRDARINEIWEGTSEIQRLTIARSLIKGS